MNYGEKYMDEIVSYMKKNLKKWYTKESLKWALIGQGYSKIEVEKALKIVDKQLANEVPPLKTRPEIKYEAVAPKQYYEEKKSLWRRIFGWFFYLF